MTAMTTPADAAVTYEVDWGLVTLLCASVEGLSAAGGHEGGTLILRRCRFKQPDFPAAWLSRITGVSRARQSIEIRGLDEAGRTVARWSAAASLAKVEPPRARPTDGTVFERLDALVEELQIVEELQLVDDD